MQLPRILAVLAAFLFAAALAGSEPADRGSLGARRDVRKRAEGESKPWELPPIDAGGSLDSNLWDSPEGGKKDQEGAQQPQPQQPQPEAAQKPQQEQGAGQQAARPPSSGGRRGSDGTVISRFSEGFDAPTDEAHLQKVVSEATAKTSPSAPTAPKPAPQGVGAQQKKEGGRVKQWVKSAGSAFRGLKDKVMGKNKRDLDAAVSVASSYLVARAELMDRLAGSRVARRGLDEKLAARDLEDAVHGFLAARGALVDHLADGE